jgi:hypothetical protein
LRTPGRFDMGDNLLDNHALELRDDVDNPLDSQGEEGGAVAAAMPAATTE